MQGWEVTVIWSGMAFVFNSGPWQGVIQFHIGLVGNVGVDGMAVPGWLQLVVMSSAAVAVVLGVAELVWLDQQQKHRELGFRFWWRLVRSCTSWKRCVHDVVVGSRVFCCSCILVVTRACYPVPLVGIGEQARLSALRVIGQHVAVNIKNSTRSWVHNRGPQQKSTFLPWTGILKGG